jgi:membrane protein
MTPAGVLDLAKEVLARMKRDNVSVLSAAVAFWGLLALIPGLAALVSLYGLVADPAEVERQVRRSTEALPDEAQQLIVSQLRTIVDTPTAGLGAGLVIGLVIALLAASAGMRTLTNAVGVVYGDTPGSRGMMKDRGQALLLTLAGTAAAALIIFVLTAASPEGLMALARWPVIAVLLVVGIGALYRIAPVGRPSTRLVTPGAVTGAVLGVVVSLGLSLYASSFGTYNETYGSLAAVVILLLWFQLTAMAVLAGAEVNQVLGRHGDR